MSFPSIFRKKLQDDTKERIPSLPDRDSSSCVLVSGLKTFSCESDAEPMETFNPDTYFEFDTINGTITTSLPDWQTANPMDQQDCILELPIVTPPRPEDSVVEISLDPLQESQIHPLLLESENEYHNAEGPNCSSDFAFDLLFPLADSDGLIDSMKPVCEPPPSLQDSTILHDKEQCNDKTMDESMFTNIHESFVYKQLGPSLPLPESFGSILCLLLHMEFSPTIPRTALQVACKVLNEQWQDVKRSSSSSSVDDERELQNTSSKIVDEFVDTLSPSVDFPLLFQASARTYRNLSNATQDNELSVFFQEAIDSPATESIQFGASTTMSTDNGWISGKKRKLERVDEEVDEEETSSMKRGEFEPSVVELAIAYGAKHSNFDRSLSTFDQTSLEQLVTTTARRLESMSSTERKNDWDHLVKVLQGSESTH